jgi:UV DNA damage endonuclease
MGANYGYCCINLTLDKAGIKIGRSMIKKTFDAKGIKYAGELAEANIRDMIEIIKWNNVRVRTY